MTFQCTSPTTVMTTTSLDALMRYKTYVNQSPNQFYFAYRSLCANIRTRNRCIMRVYSFCTCLCIHVHIYPTELANSHVLTHSHIIMLTQTNDFTECCVILAQTSTYSRWFHFSHTHIRTAVHAQMHIQLLYVLTHQIA